MEADVKREGGVQIPPRIFPSGLTYGGIADGRQTPKYPKWLYKDGKDPLKVNDKQEEEAAIADGYDHVSASILSNKYLINWFWDLEDMSPKQLRIFALEEYDVELHAEADQETLFRAVSELSRHAPQNRNRLVLMAHTVRMEYDETLNEIRRMVSKPSRGMETETISFEVTI